MTTNQEKWDEIINSGKFQGGELEVHEGSVVFRADIHKIHRDGFHIYIENTWACVCNNPPAGPFQPVPTTALNFFHHVDTPYEMQKNGTSTRIFMQPIPGDYKILFPNDSTNTTGSPRSFQLAHPELVLKALNISPQAQKAAIACALEATKMIAPFIDLIRKHKITDPIAENNDINFAQIIQQAINDSDNNPITY